MLGTRTHVACKNLLDYGPLAQGTTIPILNHQQLAFVIKQKMLDAFECEAIMQTLFKTFVILVEIFSCEIDVITIAIASEQKTILFTI